MLTAVDSHKKRLYLKVYFEFPRNNDFKREISDVIDTLLLVVCLFRTNLIKYVMKRRRH